VRLLVTGGAGFIGSNFIRHILAARADVEVVNFDNLTYAGNPENLADLASDPRYQFVHGDISDREIVNEILSAVRFDALLNFAAETHLDRSIEDSSPFLQSNILGTQCLLEAARRTRLQRFIQISTDEVYGSAPAGETFSEQSPLDPRRSYAASKAAADHLVAHANTYGVSAVILRCTNNYGPFQFPEKLIPLTIANAQEDRALPVYGDGLQERDWLFVEDYCRAIALALQNGVPGSIYNVSAGDPQKNLTVVRAILRHLGKPDSLIQYVQDRPGHDRRCALDSSQIQRELGWSPQIPFDEGIRRTIDWYRANTAWLGHVRSGEYRKYYDRHYTRRDETFSR
jgi:dTDP-glucose 4,6-dehydratase